MTGRASFAEVVREGTLRRPQYALNRGGRVQKKMAQYYAAPLCLTVVEAAGDDVKRAFQHRVHQTVLTINPPRPKSR